MRPAVPSLLFLISRCTTQSHAAILASSFFFFLSLPQSSQCCVYYQPKDCKAWLSLLEQNMTPILEACLCLDKLCGEIPWEFSGNVSWHCLIHVTISFFFFFFSPFFFQINNESHGYLQPWANHSVCCCRCRSRVFWCWHSLCLAMVTSTTTKR